MRYFKYDGPWPELQEEREQYDRTLHQLEQVNMRKHRFGNVIFWLAFILSAGGLIGLLISILPFEEGVVNGILSAIVCLIGVFISLFAALILGMLAATPFWNVDKKATKMKMQQIMQKTTDHLRIFYEYQEPYLVTKCYRCSDPKWNRHDVCLFLVDGELRITTNLRNGFFRPEKDLGCYVLSREEIAWKKEEVRDTPALALEVDGVSFLLSMNAIGFIRRFLGDSE